MSPQDGEKQDPRRHDNRLRDIYLVMFRKFRALDKREQFQNNFTYL